MDWMYLFFFLLGALLCVGAKLCPRGEWNEEYTSREQTKILTGIMALGVVLHHMAQKTCASWLLPSNRVHGLDFFINVGFPIVAVFLFCSGLGLYRSLHSKQDYLKSFIRRRILPVAAAYYLSEIIYTFLRLLAGQQMDLLRILWYLSGLHMANTYSWYAVTILFFYLAFWTAFRFCRREGLAVFWVFVFTVAYTVLGAVIDHQNDWWMRGEWWYNSIILFPLGLLFGKYEKQVTRFFRKGYWLWLLLFFAGSVLLFRQSEYLIDHRWGYYWEGTRMKIPYRLLSAGCQWMVCLVFVTFCFLLIMKVRFGNKALAWLGSVTLEFYLTHGIFVELFGYSFLDTSKTVAYIKNLPLYITAVLACSVPATLLFWQLLKGIMNLLSGKQHNPVREKTEHNTGIPHVLRAAQKKEKTAKVFRIVRSLIFPVLFLLLSLIMIFGFRKEDTRIVGGLKIIPPEGFSTTSSDNRQTVWKYTADDRKPGVLILDQEIKGESAQLFSDVDAVLKECDWLRDAELYINPQGIRMVRGFSMEFSGYPERRYYVESDDAVFLLCMIEDSRYYDSADCEDMMQQTADSIRRK